jgi:NAD(P)-dependent dehydrogenase (short-subunit alcohol dehydrogenase family)
MMVVNIAGNFGDSNFMQQIMITGSNRGIGLALVKQYLSQSNVHIFATCRNPDSANDLQALKAANPTSLTILALDINDSDAIQQAVDSVTSQTDHLDVLINNAGIYPKTPENVALGSLTRDALAHVLSSNSISPVMVTQACIDLLKHSSNPRVVMISSQMGSVTRAGSNGLSYRMSKSAMNMAAKVLAQMLVNEGITVITTHPGHVSTDRGGADAPVEPANSAARLVHIIENLTPDQTGKFYNYTGEEIPW